MYFCNGKNEKERGQWIVLVVSSAALLPRESFRVVD